MKIHALIAIFTAAGILSACAAPAQPGTASPAQTDVQSTNTNTPATETNTPLSSPTNTESAPTAASVSYTNNVMPILRDYCVECHGEEQIKEGLDLRTYDGLIAGSFKGSVITPGDANNSKLVDLMLRGKMPKRGAKPSQEQIQIIIDWVNSGALNN